MLAATILALGLITALIVAACGGDSPADDERLSFTFMAGFRAQANLPFVAAYVADQEGYFDELGLDVTIQHPSGQGEHIRLLLSGDVDLTTQPASEVIQRRADPGAPLVVVALFGQSGDLGYVVLEDSGIESPADFAGRTVGFKSVVQAEFLALLHANGLSADDVELVGVGFNPVVLPEGQVDVYPVFLNNEPDILQRVMGESIRIFQAGDAGVPTLGVTYVVTEDLLADETRREALRRFLTATMRGLQFALADPAAAIEATRAFISEEADLVHERFLLETDLANATSETDAGQRPGLVHGGAVPGAARRPAGVRRHRAGCRDRRHPGPLRARIDGRDVPQPRQRRLAPVPSAEQWRGGEIP